MMMMMILEGRIVDKDLIIILELIFQAVFLFFVFQLPLKQFYLNPFFANFDKLN